MENIKLNSSILVASDACKPVSFDEALSIGGVFKIITKDYTIVGEVYFDFNKTSFLNNRSEVLKDVNVPMKVLLDSTFIKPIKFFSLTENYLDYLLSVNDKINLHTGKYEKRVWFKRQLGF